MKRLATQSYVDRIASLAQPEAIYLEKKDETGHCITQRDMQLTGICWIIQT